MLRDNVWGPQIEDAARRDFTVNAMYYDPLREIVVDYHGGIKDVKKKLLRMIGDPAQRYREDPVRIIRAVRFAAKLGFEIEPQDARADQGDGGAARQRAAVAHLRRDDQAAADRPCAGLDRRAEEAGPAPRRLPGARRRARRGAAPRRPRAVRAPRRSPTPTSGSPPTSRWRRASCSRRMLWHDVQDGWKQRQAAGQSPFPALQDAIDAAFDARIGDISGRGKLARRHARDLDAAAALRAPRAALGDDAARAAALSRRPRLPAPARQGRRGRSGARRMVGGVLPGGRRRALSDARDGARAARRAAPSAAGPGRGGRRFGSTAPAAEPTARPSRDAGRRRQRCRRRAAA